jgi:hypothetical protein
MDYQLTQTGPEVQEILDKGAESYSKAEIDTQVDELQDGIDSSVKNKGSESNIVVGVGNSSNIGITSSSIGMETGNSAILIGNDITMNTSGEVKYNGNRVATAIDLQGKQDVIRDLQTIRDGAAAGATAVQPAALTPIQSAIDTIEAVIPSTATANNKLTDKNYVDNSISTNTANFVGTFNSLAELQAVQNPTNNDYGFVIEQDAAGNEYYDRYKFNGSQWLFEYKVESTPFTAAQWAAIQSGMTAALVTKLEALPTSQQLSTQLAGKQDTISDLSTIRSNAAAAAANTGDKAYNTADFSGLGRVNLQKNIVEVSGTDKNVLTQAMVNTANTIYHIQYDYDLNGQTITLPANVTLQFDGGSFANGTIVGNHTKVSSKNVCFKKSLKFNGSWDGVIYTKWLEFVSADDEYSEVNGVVTRNPNPTDNTLVFKQLEAILNGSGGGKVVFEKGYYQTGIVDDTPNGGTKVIGGVTYPCWKTNVYVKPDWISLCLKNCKYVDIDLNGSTIKMLKLSCPMYEFACFVNCENASIHDGILKGSADHFDYPDYVEYDEVTIRSNYELCYGIYQAGGYLDIHNMDVSYFQGDDIIVGSSPWYDQNTQAVTNYQSQGFNIHDCEASYCGRNGITVHSSYNGVMNNVNIHNIGSDADNGEIGSDGIKGQNPRSGIDMEFEDGLGLVGKFVCNNLTITDCNRRNFTCGANTNVHSLTFNNLRSIGRPMLFSNITGEVNVNSSYIETSADNFINRFVTYNETEILLTNGSNSLCNGTTFNRCYIHDNVVDGTLIFNDNYAKSNPSAYFNGCKLELHSTLFKFHVCKNCDITFLGTGVNAATGLNLYGCIVRGVLDESNHSKGFYFTNMSQYVSNDMYFEGCTFVDLKGVGGASSAGFYNDGGASMILKDCTLKNCSQLPKNNGVIKNDGCTFEDCSLTPYPATGGIVNLYLEKCKATNTSILQGGKISVSHSSLEIKGSTWPTFHNTSYIVRNSEIVDIGTNNPWTGSTGTIDAENSSFTFNKNYASANMHFKNCIIGGLITEAGFTGTKENCVFLTPLATSGTTAQRPSASVAGVGFKYFDTDIDKPVYSDGTSWLDGTGAPSAKSLVVLSISQSDYDALVTKDANTLYVITSV